jgi:hypothetical protein
MRKNLIPSSMPCGKRYCRCCKLPYGEEMRELFLGIYKSLSYKNLIYISLAELVSKNMGVFQDNRFKIQKNINLTKNEKNILHKVYLHINGRLFPSDLENWYKEIRNELMKKNYLKNHPFFGYTFTGLFKNDIKIYKNNYFDSNIVKYINSCKIECLKPIINNIEEIKLPILEKKEGHAWSYFYYDKTEMYNEAVANRFGRFDYSEKRKGVRYNNK